MRTSHHRSALPKYAEIEDALLRMLARRAYPTDSQYAYEQLAIEFGLNEDQKGACRPRSRVTLWKARVSNVKKELKKRGWIISVGRKLWILTPAGRLEVDRRTRHLM